MTSPETELDLGKYPNLKAFVESSGNSKDLIISHLKVGNARGWEILDDERMIAALSNSLDVTDRYDLIRDIASATEAGAEALRENGVIDDLLRISGCSDHALCTTAAFAKFSEISLEVWKTGPMQFSLDKLRQPFPTGIKDRHVFLSVNLLDKCVEATARDLQLLKSDQFAESLAMFIESGNDSYEVLRHVIGASEPAGQALQDRKFVQIVINAAKPQKVSVHKSLSLWQILHEFCAPENAQLAKDIYDLLPVYRQSRTGVELVKDLHERDSQEVHGRAETLREDAAELNYRQRGCHENAVGGEALKVGGTLFTARISKATASAARS